MNQWDELRVNGVSLTHSPLAEYRDVFFFADKDVRQITSTQKSVVEQELNDLGVNGDLTYGAMSRFALQKCSNLAQMLLANLLIARVIASTVY